MSEGKIARRYARALIEVASEEGLVDVVEREMGAFLQAVHGNDELKQIIFNPVFSVEERVAVVKSAAQSASWNSLTNRILLMLVEKARINSLEAILEAFSGEADRLANRLRATISSAQPLSQQRLGQIVNGLEKRTGKTVLAEADVDESLLSGVRAQIGGMVFDGSLKARLQELQRQLVN